MNILFITMGMMEDVNLKGIYPDLLRKLRDMGHCVSVLGSFHTKGFHKRDVTSDGIRLVHVYTGKTEKCNPIIKGINMITMGSKYKRAIKKYFANDHFDCVIYATPPITLVSVIKYVKQRDKSRTYLMLKDIFPQNAVDLGMMSKNGIRSVVYRYFRKMEKELYTISDKIGCMSQANVEYVLNHNSFLSREEVEVFPNCIEIQNNSLNEKEKREYRIKYGIPQNKIICIYGGNLGKPQGIPFVIDCIRAAEQYSDFFFLIIGSGTEYSRLELFIEKEKPSNVMLLKSIPRDDYNKLAAACDIGLIFLSHRFTIPNFPSRLLGYMQAKLPVLCCTDNNSDIGKTVVEGGFGWWCESNDTQNFVNALKSIPRTDLYLVKEKEWIYLKEHYSIDDHCYKIINGN